MSVLKTNAGVEIPVRQRRERYGTIAAVSQEVIMDVNGDETMSVYLTCSSFVGTIDIFGSNNADGSGYFPIVFYPFSPGCVGGTIPPSGQPMLLEALVAGVSNRVYCLPIGQLKSVRVRAVAYTSGNLTCNMVSDENDSFNQAIVSKPSTLIISTTAATGVALTATLPAVTGLRHIIDFIKVKRIGTAAGTASATPIVITTSNLPGALSLSMGADAIGVGVDKDVDIDFGSSGLAVIAIGTNTTVICPAYTGAIWRINISYRLGV
jgi:hypothetical protein